jgi:hypothetical protein
MRNTNELVEWHLLLDEWLKIRGVNFLLGKIKRADSGSAFWV